jgi:hypothetical protein
LLRVITTLEDIEDCETIHATFDAISGGGKTPYAKYLLAQPMDYLPSFWSQVSEKMAACRQSSARARVDFQLSNTHAIITYSIFMTEIIIHHPQAARDLLHEMLRTTRANHLTVNARWAYSPANDPQVSVDGGVV